MIIFWQIELQYILVLNLVTSTLVHFSIFLRGYQGITIRMNPYLLAPICLATMLFAIGYNVPKAIHGRGVICSKSGVYWSCNNQNN